MSAPQEQQLLSDLQTLNDITTSLYEAEDTHSTLERTLARLVDLMGLQTGWIFLRDPDSQGKWWGKGFRLVAHHNLPPALALDSEKAWKRNCDCQGLCLEGELSGAYNEVRCSRLAAVSGDRRGLSVHASIPLRAGADVLGILNVAAPDWESFNSRTLAILTNVGSQLGVALERSRLFEMIQEQRIHEQAALLDFTNQLLSRHDLEDLMVYLVQEVKQLLRVDACALLLPDEDDPDYLRFCAATGWRSDPVAAQRRVPADQRSGSGRVMHGQRPEVMENIEQRETAPWMADWLPTEEFKWAAVVPLLADGRSIGALVIDKRAPHRLEESEMRFLQLMANQAALALEKARLHHEEIQRYRLEEELSVARQIQLSMLPPACPVIPGWDFAAHYEAARQVGGDFYDFFDLEAHDRVRPPLAVVVADVADKGVPAALFMALSRTTIRNVATAEGTPAGVLEKANRLILEDSQTDLFLTAFYGALEPDSGWLIYSNAGHNPPLWYQARHGTFQELQADGIALGVISGIALENVTVSIAPGDLLVFYTDGVTEAFNGAMEQFGVERLQAAVASHAAEPAEVVVRAVVEAVQDFAGETARGDDLTLFVIRRLSLE